jgi:hypothetical protein
LVRGRIGVENSTISKRLGVLGVKAFLLLRENRKKNTTGGRSRVFTPIP